MRVQKQVNNNYLSAVIKGDGMPVLCLAGFGCDHYLFSKLNISAQMIMLDNRGMGESHNNLEEYSIKTLAEDAHLFMKALGHEKYHVIGISMGGIIAQEMALHYKDSLLSLSLLCTISGGDSFYPMEKITEETLRSFYALPIEKSAKLAVNATIYDKAKLDEIVSLRVEHPASIEEVLKQKRAVDDYLVGSAPLYLIETPTLILTGDKDRIVHPVNSKILKEKILGAKLEVIEKTDHLFFFEKPELVSNYLNSFICEETLYDIA